MYIYLHDSISLSSFTCGLQELYVLEFSRFLSSLALSLSSRLRAVCRYHLLKMTLEFF